MGSMAIDAVAGAFGGGLSVIMASPLDVARVRLQQAPNSSAGPGGSMFALWSRMVRQEGFHALFRGISGPLLTVSVQNSLCFQAFGVASRALQSPIVVDGGHSTEAAGAWPWPHLASVFAAGCFAGAVQTVVSVPQELLKIRLQVQSVSRGHPLYKGAASMLGSILAREGVGGLYRGTAVTLLRDMPSFGVYFSVFEVVGGALRARGASDTVRELLAGGLAGSIAWATIYPVEVVKCRVQAEGRSWQAVLKDMRREGRPAFVRGMQATLLQAFVVNGVVFYGHGLVSRALKDLERFAG